MNMKNDKKWYQKSAGIILMLILFFPVGLYLMWRYTGWNRKIKIGISATFLVAFIISCIIPEPAIESIEISIKNVRSEYDVNTKIPVIVTVSPENASTESLIYVSDSNLPFSESGIKTSSAEGTFSFYVQSGDIKSNTITINVVDISAREAAKKEAEEKRLAEETAAKEAEEKRLAEEAAAKEAEEKRLAEEAAAKEAEEKRLAEEAATKETQENIPASESTNTSPEKSGEMVWIDETAKRYHSKSDCSGMDSAYQVTKEQAEALGKTPCGRCYK